MFWGLRQRGVEHTQEAEKELAQARKQAQEIIAEAAKKAEQIIREARFFTRQVHEDLKKSLLATSEQLGQEGHNHMNQIISLYEEDLRGVAKTVQEKALEEIEQFTVQTRKNVVNLEKQMTEVMAQRQQEFESSLAQAQDEKLAALAKKAQQELPGIMQDIVGRAIPLQDHEQLVLDRLHELKNDVGFGSLRTTEDK